MSFAFLAAAPVPTPEPQSETIRRLSLESLDRSRSIPLDGSTGWWRMSGSTGLEMPPFDVVTGQVPGVAGSVLQDVRVQQRAVFVPIFTASEQGHVSHLHMLDAIRDLVDPLTGQFRLIGTSARTQRSLTVVYTGGLEGADGRDESGTYWRKFGINALACDPFARARTARTVEFKLITDGAPFLGVVGGTDAPWPGALSTSAVIGDNMQVLVTSEVPVYPTLELVGPMDSFTGTMLPDAEMPFAQGAAWSVSIPSGIPGGSTLRIITDPRARSIRLGAGDPATTLGWSGTPAAGMVARGSALRPFLPGLNTLDVSAPGGTEDTLVRLSWREGFRSLW